jgi:hypothetical protein
MSTASRQKLMTFYIHHTSTAKRLLRRAGNFGDFSAYRRLNCEPQEKSIMTQSSATAGENSSTTET